MSINTHRLFHDDSWLLEFEARVVAHSHLENRPSILLDQTAFYPESGGQMADHGSLHALNVVDVQVDEAGQIHHVVDLESGGGLPPLDEVVRGKVDKARRRIHMSLHTGQHMLSAALLKEAGGETQSSRLGERQSSIDLDLSRVDEAAVARAEALVNSVIDDDLQVRAFFPSAEELEKIPLRRRPKVTENIRIVAVGDFDFSPCGGTHCTRSSQVGLLRVMGIERVKKKARVLFSAGPRARNELFSMHNLLGAMSRDFTCGVAEVPAAVEKLRRERKEATEALGAARARLSQAALAGLEARLATEKTLVAVVEGAGPDELRKIAQALLLGKSGEEGEQVLMLAGDSGEKRPVLVARGPKADLDCGAFLKAVAQAAGGGGGGRPEFAQGRIPATADWIALARAQLSQKAGPAIS
jgi:alanyl-tRNA synthetase